MEIRFSPYNSPFIPSGFGPDVYWIGREFRDQPHSAHVYDWTQWKCRQHVEQLHREMSAAVELLPELDECAKEGIKASGRRAIDVRKFLSPNKKQINRDSHKKLLAKKPVSAQV